jgi:hypothetical protein
MSLRYAVHRGFGNPEPGADLRNRRRTRAVQLSNFALLIRTQLAPCASCALAPGGGGRICAACGVGIAGRHMVSVRLYGAACSLDE